MTESERNRLARLLSEPDVHGAVDEVLAAIEREEPVALPSEQRARILALAGSANTATVGAPAAATSTSEASGAARQQPGAAIEAAPVTSLATRRARRRPWYAVGLIAAAACAVLFVTTQPTIVAHWPEIPEQAQMLGASGRELTYRRPGPLTIALRPEQSAPGEEVRAYLYRDGQLALWTIEFTEVAPGLFRHEREHIADDPQLKVGTQELVFVIAVKGHQPSMDEVKAALIEESRGTSRWEILRRPLVVVE